MDKNPVSIKKEVCESCGADVREGTQFCYNCGKSVGAAAEVSDVTADETDPSQAALDDLAEKLKIDEPAGDKLAKAATERKKARVNPRRPTQFTWEPAADAGSRIAIVALIITATTAAVVAFAMLWK